MMRYRGTAPAHRWHLLDIPWTQYLCAAAVAALIVSGLYAYYLLLVSRIEAPAPPVARPRTFFALRSLIPSKPAAPTAPARPPAIPKPEGFLLPSVRNNAFAPGEQLHYHVLYKGIVVGHATLSVKEGPLVNGRPTLQFVSTAKSTPFFDHVFKVRDFNSSTVDRASLASVSFHQNLHEGSYEAVRNYAFDNRKKTFRVSETEGGRSKDASGSLQAPLHDVLAAFFYARTLPLEVGRDVAVRIYREGKVFSMPIKVGSVMKTIRTSMGRFRCFREEPVVKGDSIFRSQDGRLVIWMSNDERKMPVLIQATVSVGVVNVRLVGWETNGSTSKRARSPSIASAPSSTTP